MFAPISEQILDNVFLVYDKSIGVVYAPLLGKFFSTDMKGISIIHQFVKGENHKTHKFYKFLKQEGFLQEIEIPRISNMVPFYSREITISLSSSCNLRCKYCYAHGGSQNIVLPWIKIKKGIDQLIEYVKNNDGNEIEIGFHGTGEALIEWKTLIRTVQYTKMILPKSWRIHFSLVTNGTLINDEIAEFLSENNFSVVLSIDGTEEMHNFLRPKADGSGSFNETISGAVNLAKYGVEFTMRSTITGLNQGQLVDFVVLCASVGCKDISIAPVSFTGRGKSGIQDIDPKRFLKEYAAAKIKARKLNVQFGMPSDYLDNASARHCNADGELMALMPEGFISCCTRVTRSSDDLANMFFVGKITKQGVEIDQDKVDKLRSLNVYNYKECTDCFAKYACSGGCHHTRLINNNKQPSTYCEIMQSILWNTLKSNALIS